MKLFAYIVILAGVVFLPNMVDYLKSAMSNQSMASTISFLSFIIVATGWYFLCFYISIRIANKLHRAAGKTEKSAPENDDES
jgi:hypothetical protein